MAENQYPIRTREDTPNGYIIRTDWGPKLGVSVSEVIIPPATEEEIRQNRRNLDRVLATMGYRLALD